MFNIFKKKLNTNNITWHDVTIDKYLKIKDIIKDETESESVVVKLISIIYDIDEDKVWNMPLSEIQEYNSNFMFLKGKPVGKNVKSLKINNMYYAVTDINNFSYSQYVDFQNYYKQGEKMMAELLSTILIPKNKEYCDGYNINNTIKDIKENLDVETAIGIQSFFYRRSVRSTKNSLKCLSLIMKMNGLLTKNKKMKGLTKEAAEQVKTMAEHLNQVMVEFGWN